MKTLSAILVIFTFLLLLSMPINICLGHYQTNRVKVLGKSFAVRGIVNDKYIDPKYQIMFYNVDYPYDVTEDFYNKVQIGTYIKVTYWASWIGDLQTGGLKVELE